MKTVSGDIKYMVKALSTKKSTQQAHGTGYKEKADGWLLKAKKWACVVARNYMPLLLSFTMTRRFCIVKTSINYIFSYRHIVYSFIVTLEFDPRTIHGKRHAAKGKTNLCLANVHATNVNLSVLQRSIVSSIRPNLFYFCCRTTNSAKFNLFRTMRCVCVQTCCCFFFVF